PFPTDTKTSPPLQAGLTETDQLSMPLSRKSRLLPVFEFADTKPNWIGNPAAEKSGFTGPVPAVHPGSPPPSNGGVQTRTKSDAVKAEWAKCVHVSGPIRSSGPQ